MNGSSVPKPVSKVTSKSRVVRGCPHDAAIAADTDGLAEVVILMRIAGGELLQLLAGGYVKYVRRAGTAAVVVVQVLAALQALEGEGVERLPVGAVSPQRLDNEKDLHLLLFPDSIYSLRL